MSHSTTDVHIAAIEYELPSTSWTLEELAVQGRIRSPVEALRTFGFERAWVADDTGERLATAAVERLLENAAVDPGTIDVVLYAGATAASHATRSGGLGAFTYPAAKLQYDFGFVNARPIGISQSGCLGLMTAISLGRALLTADASIARVLCVSVDVLPAGSTREILYNVISDGACALLLERGHGPNRIVAERQITKGYYWDCEALGNEIVAAYFPTARTIIGDTLAAAGLTQDDVAVIVPHNVSRRSWDILLQLTGLDAERLYADNIALKAHVISGDNFINLADAERAGRLRRGDRLLLFNFGFGASWACMLVEH
ncbi:MAG TPA: 3-oxoacyl-[acyl-carrier-protein] synthase III C-terminal domain-containing protein [Vicinamibacterales bacterium]|nr:3-oxoacyl-[acyl-carrier-protein] synthase III C-terminal domain-containing protein [Vicinamibacterales bacterium]